MTEFELREVRLGDEGAFREAVRAFEESDPDWQFAFRFDAATDFPEYLARLERERLGEDLPEGLVPHTLLIAVTTEGRVAGRVSLRHELNGFLHAFGGHVGYGVVASFRRQGLATEMLRRTRPIARSLGIDRLLVTCDDDNLGSIRVVERCGGALAEVRPQPGSDVPKRRYWLDVTEDATFE